MTAVTGTRTFAAGPIRWTLALTQFLLILDTAVLNVAAPHIAADVGLGSAAQSWVINAFVIPFAGLLLAAGYLADRYGPRRTMTCGLVVLAAGGVLGVVAVDTVTVLASRVVQGVGGALAGAAAMSLLLHLFAGADRARALALYATMAGAGGVAGTILSGTFTDWFGWRSLFALNVIGALVIAVAVRRVVPADLVRADRFGSRSVLGATVLTVALAATAYAITNLAIYSLRSPHIWGAGVLAVAATTVFVRVETRAARPIIPRRVWGNRRLLTALVLAAAAQLTLTPLFLLVSVYPQQYMGYSATSAGLVLLPMSVLIVVFAPNLPALVGRFGSRNVMIAAFGVVAVGAGALAILLDPSRGYLVAILGPTLLIGCGVPAVAMTTNIATAAAAGDTPAGAIAGLLTTAQQFGAAIGLAAIPAIAAARSGGYLLALATIAAFAGIAALIAGIRARP
ncbi:MFS transporter [Nocardia sp. NPDC058640]|uniref:MFS transporter n=1 Tax=Nocardia sp. NPDC058640 TaxID=3346571 RepID=UPI003657FA69